MPIIGFHASHEQIDPKTLLDAVQHAEEAGFQAAMCSDHFAPWSARQGHSGFAWSWLGAALQKTSLSFGVVSAPGQRYHPAIVAQAAATLNVMFPGRLWTALGSGEALNEHITGGRWPSKVDRDARLEECAAIMRALFAGEVVSHRGHVTVDRARLWTLPERSPSLIGAAVSPETARRAGGWADGLITVNQPRDRLAAVLDAFRAGGGEGKPTYLQAHISWAQDPAMALAIAHEQWRSNVFSTALAWELELPEQFDDAARFVTPEDVQGGVLVSSHTARFMEWIADFVELGFDGIYLHHVGQEQRAFIDAFGRDVLPAFARTAG